ncbi:MAG TPA: CcmD family protein, partial [Kouleothrix sp.]|nr:CcmD family protein [Kouleothrix sp.]
MPNFLLDPGVAIYAALAVALVVWLGIFAFLWRLDQQARELRRRL